ncbi:hypothetical protein MARA_02900 (plasmid) [Mycolicibacterium arabiense]|uniref:Uncharacterized protein n=1 Tax=Mycolicibacterium arabiense TaxID=1286181 RepID=A0A7I7RRM9_9MYCO|nr:hypothetical protein [Mycolicibacterium arabiense]MCV7372128.1 hypothetical protein [Mycolicibacterium arabiense]BBY46860.1 hypothetical protein MARA_02900 [Mycolicibacterium arabiense]
MTESRRGAQGDLDALALLTASYDGLMGEVIQGVLADKSESEWYPASDDTLSPSLQKLERDVQKLVANVEQLTSLLSGMTLIARVTVAQWAKMVDTAESEVLDAIGRFLHK